MSYLLAINCGSSSIKGKLFHLPSSKSEALKPAAQLSVSNISSKGEKVKIKIEWHGEEGRNVEEEGEDGDQVDCMSRLLVYAAPWTTIADDRHRQIACPITAEQVDECGQGGQGRGQICDS